MKRKLVVIHSSSGQIQLFRPTQVGDRIEYRRVDCDVVIEAPAKTNRYSLAAVLIGFAAGMGQFLLFKLYDGVFNSVATMLIDATL